MTAVRFECRNKIRSTGTPDRYEFEEECAQKGNRERIAHDPWIEDLDLPEIPHILRQDWPDQVHNPIRQKYTGSQGQYREYGPLC